VPALLRETRAVAFRQQRAVDRSADAASGCAAAPRLRQNAVETLEAGSLAPTSRPSCVGRAHHAQTRAIEPGLKALAAPTPLVGRTIPGTRRRVELDGARIFFPEERWRELDAQLRAHWQEAAR
jgi:hypothetical protein